MTEQRIYFPVGQPILEDSLARWSLTQIQHRDLNDPRFSAFETNFNWRSFIRLNIADQEVLERVTQSLDQIARTPEGQQTIRQAYAMQHQRDIEEAGRSVPARPIEILESNQTIYDYPSNRIYISDFEILNTSHEHSDGHCWRWNYQNALFHELSHVKDPLLSRSGIRALNHRLGANPNPGFIEETAEWLSDLGKQVFTIPTDTERYFELPAIWETNRFMRRYYGEPGRLSHNMLDSASCLIAGAQNGGRLGEDGVYDDFLTPPPTPPSTPPKARGKSH